MPISRILLLCATTLLVVRAELTRGDEAKGGDAKTDVTLQLEPVELLGDARWRHAGAMTHIEPLADGRRALSTSRDGSVRLWDLTDGRELRRFVPSSCDDIWNVKLLPGEREFLSCGADNHVTRWDIETGKAMARYRLPAEGMRLAVVPGGKQFIACDGGRHASLWDIKTEKRLRVFKGHTDSVYSAAVSPNGSLLITCSKDGSVRAWEVASGKKLWVIASEENPDGHFGDADPFGAAPADDLDDVSDTEQEHKEADKKPDGPGHYEDVFTVCFLPDGDRVVSCSKDESIAMWNAIDGKLLWKKSVSGEATVIACSPDGKQLATTCDDNTIHLLRAEDGKSLRKIPVPGGAHWTVTFSHDGKRLLSGGDHILHQWDAATGKQLFPPPKNEHTKGAVKHIALSPDGERLYAASQGDVITVWDLSKRTRIAAWPAPSEVDGLRLFPDGRRLLLVSNDQITCCDAATGKELHQIDVERTVRWATLADEGKLIVARSYGSRLLAWRSDNGRSVYDVRINDVDQIARSNDGQRLFVLDGHGFEARKVSDGTVITRFDRHDDAEDAALVALADDRALLLFSDAADTSQLRVYLPNIAQGISPLSLEKVRQLSSQLGEDDFVMRERATQALIQGGPPVLPELSRVKTNDSEVRWRIAKIRDGIRKGMIPIKPLEPVQVAKNRSAVVAHPKLAQWATISGQNCQSFAQLGRLNDKGIQIGVPTTGGHSPNCLAYSPDGTRLYTGNRNGTISVYRVSTKQ